MVVQILRHVTMKVSRSPPYCEIYGSSSAILDMTSQPTRDEVEEWMASNSRTALPKLLLIARAKKDMNSTAKCARLGRVAPRALQKHCWDSLSRIGLVPRRGMRLIDEVSRFLARQRNEQRSMPERLDLLEISCVSPAVRARSPSFHS